MWFPGFGVCGLFLVLVVCYFVDLVCVLGCLDWLDLVGCVYKSALLDLLI